MSIVQLLIKAGLVTQQKINEIIDNKPAYYQEFEIKKGNKIRKIAKPTEELATIQKIVKGYYSRLPISSCATAYERGCSVKKNAQRHIKAKHILHTDISNFFGSISQELFIRVYSKKYDDKDVQFLWEIASLRGALPIGSALSPVIANRVMYAYDKKLKRLKMGVKYTRYADDMIFSSKKYMDKELIGKIGDILQGSGLKLNFDKTYYMNSRKSVTGVLINNKGQLSLGTRYKKQLKSEIYTYLVKKRGNPKKICGKIAYLNQIEPQYAQVLKQKYANLDSVRLFAKSGL